MKALSKNLKTTKKRLGCLQSLKSRGDVTKRNLLVHQVLKKKTPKKKKPDTSSEASEEETQDKNRLKEKSQFLRHTVRTQRNQIETLYREINLLQEKEEERLARIEAFDKLDRYVKRMSKNNGKVKTFW